MKLAFKKIGAAPLLILHGLFGSSDNWQTIAKRFAEDFTVYLVDQRNHGHSPHSDAFDYDLLATDLRELFDDESIPSAFLIGHSMGGKAAMRFAQLHPQYIAKLVVVDMGVKTYPPHHQDVLAAFHAVDLPNITARSEAEAAVAPLIANQAVRQFLLKNIYRKSKEEYAWRVNFRVLEAKMREILAPLPSGKVVLPTLFIYGTRSNYIIPADFDAIREIFPLAEFSELPTDHWVHAEDPDGFYDEVKKFVTL